MKLRAALRFDNPAMACPRCGEACTCSAVAVLCAPDEDFYRPPAPDSAWRSEVTSRIAAHRAKRKTEDLSLPLEFEAKPVSPVVLRVAEKFANRPIGPLDLPPKPLPNLPIRKILLRGAEWKKTASAAVSEAEAISAAMEVVNAGTRSSAGAATAQAVAMQPQAPPAPLPPFPRVKHKTAKVITFPAVAAPSNELAEPVADQLRIFEVADEGAPMPAAPLAHIGIAPEEPIITAPARFDLPLQVAPATLRAHAAVLDLGFVGIGLAMAGAAAMFSGGLPAPSKVSAAIFALATGVMLWLYFFLALYFGRSTLGMRAQNLGVCNFDGEPPRRAVLAWRATATLLSMASLALGFLWAFVDDDHLCWHDRMTRTYLRELA